MGLRWYEVGEDGLVHECTSDDTAPFSRKVRTGRTYKEIPLRPSWDAPGTIVTTCPDYVYRRVVDLSDGPAAGQGADRRQPRMRARLLSWWGRLVEVLLSCSP